MFEETEAGGKTPQAPLSPALHSKGHCLWENSMLLQLEGQREEEGLGGTQSPRKVESSVWLYRQLILNQVL